MPLYKGKTTIQALGGNRIEWKAQFRVEELGKMLVTAPPCNMRVAWAPGPPGVLTLPRRWDIQIDAPGPLVLEGYDIGFQDTEPPVERGFVAVAWNEATSTVSLSRRNWGGAGNPVLAIGDSVLLTLWLRNTAVPTVYSKETP